MRGVILICVAPLLSSCFIFIPGSVTSAVMDSATGAEGAHCFPMEAKVGDRIRTPGGGMATVSLASGVGTRCQSGMQRGNLRFDP